MSGSNVAGGLAVRHAAASALHCWRVCPLRLRRDLILRLWKYSLQMLIALVLRALLLLVEVVARRLWPSHGATALAALTAAAAYYYFLLAAVACAGV
jgi:hypothetical protein